MYPAAFFRVCDEVRTERSGKSILIGQYNDAIVFPSFPAKLPQLTFIVTARYDKHSPAKTVRFRVTFPDGSEKLSKILNPAPPSEALLQHTEISFSEVRLNWRIGPIAFNAPGLIRVAALIDELEVPAGIVAVREASNQDIHPGMPPEFLMLIAMGAKDNDDAKEAVFRFFDFLEPTLKQPGLDHFLDNLITTLQLDNSHIAAFTATPIQDWSRVRIENIKEDPRPTLVESNPYYCVFEFPPDFGDISEAVVTTEEAQAVKA